MRYCAPETRRPKSRAGNVGGHGGAGGEADEQVAAHAWVSEAPSQHARPRNQGVGPAAANVRLDGEVEHPDHQRQHHDGAQTADRKTQLAVVNAAGDIVDWRTGKIVAGARRADGSGFADTVATLKRTLEAGKPHGRVDIDDPVLRSTTLAAEVVAEAIVRGVRAAKSVDGWPAAADLR